MGQCDLTVGCLFSLNLQQVRPDALTAQFGLDGGHAFWAVGVFRRPVGMHHRVVKPAEAQRAAEQAAQPLGKEEHDLFFGSLVGKAARQLWPSEKRSRIVIKLE